MKSTRRMVRNRGSRGPRPSDIRLEGWPRERRSGGRGGPLAHASGSGRRLAREGLAPETVDDVDDRIQGRRGGWSRCSELPASNQRELLSNVVETLEEREPAAGAEITVDRADRTAKDAVDGHAERGGLSIHRSAATDDEIGVPDETETVDDLLGDDDLAVAEPARPFAFDQLSLAVAAWQDDHAGARRAGDQVDGGLEEFLADGIVIVGLGGGRAHRHDE